MTTVIGDSLLEDLVLKENPPQARSVPCTNYQCEEFLLSFTPTAATHVEKIGHQEENKHGYNDN